MSMVQSIEVRRGCEYVCRLYRIIGRFFPLSINTSPCSCTHREARKPEPTFRSYVAQQQMGPPTPRGWVVHMLSLPPQACTPAGCQAWCCILHLVGDRAALAGTKKLFDKAIFRRILRPASRLQSNVTARSCGFLWGFLDRDQGYQGCLPLLMWPNKLRNA